MSELRDYEKWHQDYDDPDSGLSHRLRAVQGVLRDVLDRHDGPLRILSACAGDGRDVLDVLAGRADRDRVTVTLVELNPALADRARMRAADDGVTVDVRTADAGVTESYAGAAPADLVLLVGIFGNISVADIEQTARAAPALCTPGATLIWSRGMRDDNDVIPSIRDWFIAAGFTELDVITTDGADGVRRVLGVVRYDGLPQPLVAGQHLFTFVR